MEQDTAAFVAMDTLKETIAVAVAEAGRSGEVRFVGEIPNRADAVRRLLDKLARTWTLRPLVEALQAMRGIAFLSAVVLVAEIGDFRRVANPRQLMA
ncbi:transposase [Azospirillum sp. BE72]|uniref:transposase n=1 Tax=Azospirillum sp. BE72 TaxID=2817776 RepID=UPI00285BC8D0|nr:transposase [Azospirillum sp. BE72]MDR6773695.1 transposase [Azospirillum sp. BE72]